MQHQCSGNDRGQGEETCDFEDIPTEEEDEEEEEEEQQLLQNPVFAHAIEDDFEDVFLEGSGAGAEQIEKPHEGMTFESQDHAYYFYNTYAKRVGFGVRKGGVRRSMKDNSIIGRRFYCNKEGFRAKKYKKDVASKKRKRGETRVGCGARLFVNKAGDGTWVASLFEETHAHKCETPKKSHLFTSHRNVDQNRGALIEKMRSAGIRTNLAMDYFSEEAQGRRNVGFTERDMRNHLRTKRLEVFQKGDAQCLLNYLQDKQCENPHFFYAIQLDTESQMTNFFWADAKSRIDYSYFGDVVCLDATYGTNAYAKPFVPIVGVDNHMQTVLFGYALMLDETEFSFEWVLQTWVKTMNGAHPKVIFTDQDPALTAAIAKVLPNTHHRLCLWHIYQNAKKNLGSLFRRKSQFGENFSKCIRSFETIEEFEIGWNNLLTRYDLHANGWISKLYSKREKWVPVYSNEFFCADMSTPQRSESINKFFKGFLDRGMLLLDFVKGVDKALLSRREAEIDANFHMNNVLPTLMFHTPIEEMASKIYTPPIFLKFREELVCSLRYACEKVSESITFSTYICKPVGEETKFRTVHLNSTDQNVSCSCHKYEFMGILCRHILRVFIVENICHIPEQYILRRWTVNAKDGIVKDDRGEKLLEDCHAPLSLRYSILCHEAIEVATDGSSFVEVFEIARQGLLRTKREIQAAKIKENTNIGRDCPTNEKETIQTQAGTITIKELTVVKTKGRPGRYKAFWEKKSGKNHKKKTSTTKGQQKTKSLHGAQHTNIPQSSCGPTEVSNYTFPASQRTNIHHRNYYQNTSTRSNQHFNGYHPVFPLGQDLTSQSSSQVLSSQYIPSFNHIPINNEKHQTS